MFSWIVGLKREDQDAETDIPLLPKEKMDELDAYFRSIRPWFPMSIDDHQKWRLLMKTVPKRYEDRANGHKSDVWSVLALDSVIQSGIPDEIRWEMEHAKAA